MKTKTTITFLFLMGILNAQNIKVNEELVFSFKTTTNKLMTLTRDVNNNYIVYRYGTESKTELEVKDNLKDDIPKFYYSFVFRGGGPGNEAVDINWVYFYNKQFRYVIYDEYISVSDKRKFGIQIINQKTKEEFTIDGIAGSKKGSLLDLRFSDLLPSG
jgi:hypothetical protein